jgi:hypothetical protein
MQTNVFLFKCGARVYEIGSKDENVTGTECQAGSPDAGSGGTGFLLDKMNRLGPHVKVRIWHGCHEAKQRQRLTCLSMSGGVDQVGRRQEICMGRLFLASRQALQDDPVVEFICSCWRNCLFDVSQKRLHGTTSPLTHIDLQPTPVRRRTQILGPVENGPLSD